MADAENIPDIDHGLASLTEETTAAEFLRSKGQHRKVKTINKEKLKQWILQAINQTRAGMADAYNDEEKEELLRKTQEQLEEVMARAAKAENEVRVREEAKDAMANEIAALQTRAAKADNVEDKSEELAAAMATIAKLQDQYHTSHKEAEDLRLDVYELQDQLNTKMSLLRTTMEEKDRLKETMQGLMIRAGDLTGGVLHLDQEYYNGQHAAESQIDDDAELTEQFFHDFEVGTKVIESLSGDLGKLQELTEAQQSEEEKAADPSAGLLARELALIEQLQSGSLSAVDVAQPVAGLIEALEGAREEANQMEQEAANAMGMPQTAGSISSLPDSDGDAAEVLAGATAVSRELAALFAKQRNRLGALQMMIDEADSARNQEEEVAEQAHQSYDSLLGSVADELERAGLPVDQRIVDEGLPDEERVAAAKQAVAGLSEQAKKADAEKYYNALLQNIKQQSEELGVEGNPALADEAADGAARNAAAAQAVLELAQKAGDTAALEQYDALLGEIAEQAESAGVEQDPLLLNADADVAERKVAASQAVARMGAKAADDSVQSNYDALLERLAEEAQSNEIDVSDTVVNNERAIEERQVEAEKVIAGLSEKSAASKDIVALQEQLDDALSDVEIDEPETTDEAEAEGAIAAKEAAEPAPVTARDHSAVKDLFAKRLTGMVSKIKGLEQEKADDAMKIAQLEQQAAQSQQALEEAQAALEASKDDRPYEKELARTLMKAVQGDEDLAGDDAVLDLALAIDDYNDELAEEEDNKNLLDRCTKVVDALAAKKHAVMTEIAQIKAGQLDRDAKMENMEREVKEAIQERDEMAESGKEIISQLTQQRDAKVKEYDEIKEQLQANDQKLCEFEGTMHAFADSLSELSEDEDGQSDAVATAKAQARQALEQMPGEKSIPLKAEVAEAVCVSGIALIDALAKDGGAKAQSLQAELASAAASLATQEAAVATKEKELADLKQQLDEKDKAVEVAKAEAEEVTASLKQQLDEKDKAVEAAKAEAEEVAASGKEVIEHLNEQRDKQQAEIESLQAQLKRLDEAEEANRKMAEEISALAAAAKGFEQGDEIENLQADLEVTLSEVPGDDQVPVREGLSKDLASDSVKVVDKIKSDLAQRGAAIDALTAERDQLKELLRQSKAAIEEYRVRGEESSKGTEDELKTLSAKLSELEKAKASQARELQEQIDEYRLEENVLKKKIDELNKQVAARDEEIIAIKRAADSGADEHVEVSALQAQNKALEEELTDARQKLKAFEDARSALGDKDSFSAEALRNELSKQREERDELRSRMRQVEDELATERSRVESMKEDRQRLREEFEAERRKISEDLERERTAHGEDAHELKRLRGDLAGAQARIRALSESGDEEDA